jgi:hypothetical protein
MMPNFELELSSVTIADFSLKLTTEAFQLPLLERVR